MNGAIGYNPSTKKWASVSGYSSRSSAESAVLSRVGSGGRVAAWCDDGWFGALAVSSNGAWSGGTAETLQEAQQDAIRKCENNGGRNPRIVCSICSDD